MLRTTIDSAWVEYRQGDACEMRTESVVKTQQGTYQCVASNEHGRAMTQCYLLVGGINFSIFFSYRRKKKLVKCILYKYK